MKDGVSQQSKFLVVPIPFVPAFMIDRAGKVRPLP
jgi:hypothetical protein